MRYTHRHALDDIEHNQGETMTTTDPTTTTTQAEQYGRDIAQSLHELNASIEAYQGDDERDPFSTWLDDSLELVTLRAQGDHERFRVEVLVTVGGPRAEVIRDSMGGEHVEIAVYWWGDTWHGRAWVPSVASMLDEIGRGY